MRIRGAPLCDLYRGLSPPPLRPLSGDRCPRDGGRQHDPNERFPTRCHPHTHPHTLTHTHRSVRSFSRIDRQSLVRFMTVVNNKKMKNKKIKEKKKDKEKERGRDWKVAWSLTNCSLEISQIVRPTPTAKDQGNWVLLPILPAVVARGEKCVSVTGISNNLPAIPNGDFRTDRATIFIFLFPSVAVPAILHARDYP